MSNKTQAIHSTLPMNNPRFSDIVQRFVAGLDERLDEIELTIRDGDFKQLADLGHWLKGAAGNCGFAQMSAAGIQLEDAARNTDQKSSTLVLLELRDMKSRIVLSESETNATVV